MRGDVASIRRVTLSRKAPEQTSKTFATAPPPDALIIDGDAIIIDDETSRPVAVQLEWDPYRVDALARSLRNVRWDDSKPAPRGSGRLSGIRNPHVTFGFSPPVPLRRRYSCRTCSFDLRYPDIRASLGETAVAAAALFATVAPHAYEHTRQAVEESIAPCWRIAHGAPWTSGIINRTVALPYHRDSGNIQGSWSLMLTARRHCDGGFLHLADYDAWLTLPNGSLSIFDGQSVLHGVSPFTIKRPDGYRYTAVFYSKAALHECADSIADEPARAARAATEAQDKRAERRAEAAREAGQ